MSPVDRTTSLVARLPSARTIRVELLAGLVVALSLIPEVVSFSILAGVDPKVGLFASVTMAISIAIVGGRPAMVSAAAGAMALVVVSLVRDHGQEYLFAAAILAGAIQVTLGLVGAQRLMRFVSPAVMTGFVNGLAILIFAAQIPHITGGGTAGWLVVAAVLAIIVVLPRIVSAVPAPLVAIGVLTVVVVVFGVDIPNVGDEGEMPSALPVLGIPSVPLTWETLGIIAPYAFTLALVGLLESLLTARLVDQMTATTTDEARETRGQGIANVITGFFGGMPGCAMIGQTVINVRSGGRTRLSTFTAGAFLLLLVMVFGDEVAAIPMAALGAVMVSIAFVTFAWREVDPRNLRMAPRGEVLAMIVTTGTTVATHNLAIGVGAGVAVSLATGWWRRRSRTSSTVAGDGASRGASSSVLITVAGDHEPASSTDGA
ncbi:MAG: SulP family inorganic anion transporter [Patulibacter sp.]